MERKVPEVFMEIETTFTCAFCFSVNELLVDSTGGMHQEYTEDCSVCCRPNRLSITIDEGLARAGVSAEPE